MEKSIITILGALLFLSWIIIGAMTGHEDYEDKWRVRYLESAQRYHMAHALAILALINHQAMNWFSVFCWILGLLLFSGNLYRKFWQKNQTKTKLIPIGGVFLMLGWVYFIFKNIF